MFLLLAGNTCFCQDIHSEKLFLNKQRGSNSHDQASLILSLTRQQQLINNKSLSDSLLKFLRAFPYNPTILYHTTNLKDIGKSSLNILSSETSNINTIKNEVTILTRNAVTSPIVLSRVKTEYFANSDSSYFPLDHQFSYLDKFQLNADWTIAGIPVEMNINKQDWFGVTNSVNTVSVKFDRDNYLATLKQELTTKINPNNFLSQLQDPVASLKESAEKELYGDLAYINTVYSGVLKEKINSLGDLSGFFKKDIVSVRNQLIDSKYSQSVKNKETQLAQLIQKKNNGESVDSSQIAGLEKSINELRGSGQILIALDRNKRNWDSSGLLKKINDWELVKAKKLSKYMNDAGTIIKLAKQHLNLSDVQRLFLSINKLNLGNNVISASPLTLDHFLNKGIMTEFLNNNKYLMLFSGKQPGYSSITDLSFVNNLFSQPTIAKAISLGTGGNGHSHTHLSVMSFDQSFNSGNIYNFLQPVWRSLVTSVSNQMQVGENGSITAEISRSASKYISGKTIVDSMAQRQSAMDRMLSGANLIGSMAFSFKYEDEHPKEGLSYLININKAALGYDNPGNPFLNSGSEEAELRVSKTFFKKKLKASWRSDIRQYKYSTDNDDRWRNSYSVLDISLKLPKGNFVSFRYMPDQMVRISGNSKSKVTSINRISVQASLSGKIGNKYYHNYLDLSYQSNNYIYQNTFFFNKSVSLSTYQSLTINKKIVYINLNFSNNKNASQYFYYNSSLMTESGISYQILKHISGSSAITYSSIKDWYQQTGIKQTLSGQLNRNFNINFYLDARKNLKLYRPLLYGPVRIDISVQYLFKK